MYCLHYCKYNFQSHSLCWLCNYGGLMTVTNNIGLTFPVSNANGGTNTTTAANARDYLKSPPRIGKNYIVGGNFDTNPWQRGTTISVPNSTNQKVGPDRWMLYNLDSGAGVFEMKKIADGPSSASNSGMIVNNCLQIKATTTPTKNSLSKVMLQQCIEGLYGLNITQQAMTLSFWIKATVTGNYCVTVSTNRTAHTYVLNEYQVN